MFAVSTLSAVVLQGGKGGTLAPYLKTFWLSPLGRCSWYPVGRDTRHGAKHPTRHKQPPKQRLIQPPVSPMMTWDAYLGCHHMMIPMLQAHTHSPINSRNAAPKTILINISSWLDERKIAVWVKTCWWCLCGYFSAVFKEKKITLLRVIYKGRKRK